MRLRSVAVLALVSGLFAAGLAVPALATAQQHTLTISAPAGAVVDFGDTVHLAGKLTPGALGEQVRLRDRGGVILATTKTIRYGKFAFDFAPRRPLYVHAEWQGLRSNAIQVKARPRVTAAISNVLVFGTAAVSGTVAPWDPGAPVTVAVFRDGTRVQYVTARLGSSSQFHVAVPVAQPGTYSAHVVYDTPESLKGLADTAHVATPLPSLSRGSTGETVLLLERRLAQLHYLITNVNTTYDSVTGDSVMAFRKVQGLARTWTVDASVWRALASPRYPHPRDTSSGFHVEIDQTEQVIYTVQDGAITNILHTSTGKPSTPTHDGSFAVHRKVNGFSIGHLYYPSYFDGNRAVHGWTDVPEYAASHGCARIPYWDAKFMYDRMPIGTRVLVYHS
jgi:hypothetical protein